MAHSAVSAIRFSLDRRADLARLGVTEAQIAELEAVLPTCRVLIDDYARLTDVRDELNKLIAALEALRRVFSPRTKATREVLSRWQTAADALRHPFGRDPQFTPNLDIGRLLQAARDAQHGLGSAQRRSHTADPEPIRRIGDALSLGWAKTHDNRPLTAFLMPARTFREIVQFAYEAMGFEPDYVPEKGLKAYSRWRRIEATKRTAERANIT